MERDAPHLIAHLGGLSYTPFPDFFENIFDSGNRLLYCPFRAAAQRSNIRIAEVIQNMEQKPLPLLLGAEGQYRHNLVQRFPLADHILRGGTVG